MYKKHNKAKSSVSKSEDLLDYVDSPGKDRDGYKHQFWSYS